MIRRRLFPTDRAAAPELQEDTQNSRYLLSLYQQQAERGRGADIVMWQGQAASVLRPAEEARLFTGNLSGCVGIGYVALLQTGERHAYLQHADYWDVRHGKVFVPTPSLSSVVDARAVLMARALEPPLEPFTADAPEIPYRSMSTGMQLAPLVESMVQLCDDPSKVTVYPYSKDSPGPYGRSLLIDVQPEDRLGVIIADGKHVVE